jgi:hypothetical protein
MKYTIPAFLQESLKKFADQNSLVFAGEKKIYLQGNGRRRETGCRSA